ncbi:hypothetical protein CMO91_06025 [Candidatus Woesearchaeota archaeon]|nr:hypothetical protein [Candidatus Woesearchaeota archaeon]|tara:strand:- start:292 stop:936 length:645 start_codon:yes stop_codon:yes gene_type:complete
MQEEILRLFTTTHNLTFTQIEKSLGKRSNHVSYHLGELVKKGLLEKKTNSYQLSETGERQLPHLSSKTSVAIPVVLLAIKRKNKVLFVKRSKRPYKDYWGLVGGKLRDNESILVAASRLAEKVGVVIDGPKVHACMHEQVVGEQVKHSFILFLVSATTKDTPTNGKWCVAIPEPGIPSDKWLVENKLDEEADIPCAELREGSQGLRMEIEKIKN